MPLVISKTCWSCDEPFGEQFLHRVLLRHQYFPQELEVEDEKTIEALCMTCQFNTYDGTVDVIRAVKNAPEEMFHATNSISTTLAHVLYQAASFCRHEYRLTVHPVVREEAAKMLYRWRNRCDFAVIDKALMDMDRKWPKMQWGVGVCQELGYLALDLWVHRAYRKAPVDDIIMTVVTTRNDLSERIEEAKSLGPIVTLLNELSDDSYAEDDIEVAAFEKRMAWCKRH
ncbi:hypothetical protein ABKA04_007484 [Annulohypoxylon sp. FPYF3050]